MVRSVRSLFSKIPFSLYVYYSEFIPHKKKSSIISLYWGTSIFYCFEKKFFYEVMNESRIRDPKKFFGSFLNSGHIYGQDKNAF